MGLKQWCAFLESFIQLGVWGPYKPPVGPGQNPGVVQVERKCNLKYKQGPKIAYVVFFVIVLHINSEEKYFEIADYAEFWCFRTPYRPTQIIDVHGYTEELQKWRILQPSIYLWNIKTH